MSIIYACYEVSFHGLELKDEAEARALGERLLALATSLHPSPRFDSDVEVEFVESAGTEAK